MNGTAGPATSQAVRACPVRLEGRFMVVRAILYGSRARGDHRPDSDPDLVLVLAGHGGDAMAATVPMADEAFDVLLDTGIRISPLVLWRASGSLPKPTRTGSAGEHCPRWHAI